MSNPLSADELAEIKADYALIHGNEYADRIHRLLDTIAADKARIAELEAVDHTLVEKLIHQCSIRSVYCCRDVRAVADGWISLIERAVKNRQLKPTLELLKIFTESEPCQ